jgi:hypothetical protein
MRLTVGGNYTIDDLMKDTGGETMNTVSQVLWQDQAEFYFVCDECYAKYKNTQWSGSTRVPDWAEYRRAIYVRLAEKIKNQSPCELC